MNNKIYMFLTILIVLSFMALAETTVSRTVADDGTVIATFTELYSFGNQYSSANWQPLRMLPKTLDVPWICQQQRLTQHYGGQ